MIIGRVLLCGGYGTFGRRAVARLGRNGELEIIIAGRNLDLAEQAVVELQPLVAAKLTAAVVDANCPDLTALRALPQSRNCSASGKL